MPCRNNNTTLSIVSSCSRCYCIRLVSQVIAVISTALSMICEGRRRTLRLGAVVPATLWLVTPIASSSSSSSSRNSHSIFSPRNERAWKRGVSFALLCSCREGRSITRTAVLREAFASKYRRGSASHVRTGERLIVPATNRFHRHCFATTRYYLPGMSLTFSSRHCVNQLP